MRKLIPLMLAIALVLSMNVNPVAYATENGVAGGTTKVTGNYVAGEAGGQIIKVDIAWEGMDFTYNGASAKVWDADKHQYSQEVAAAWAESKAYISITNHSNVMLYSELTYSPSQNYGTMGLAFADEFPYVGSAYVSEGAGAACNVVVRVIPTGYLLPDTPADAEVGQIQLTMTPTEDYSGILDALSGYGDFPVSTATAGERYFTSQTVKDQVGSAYTDAKNAVGNIDKQYELYEKNKAINKLLTSYYNNLYIMQ